MKVILISAYVTLFGDAFINTYPMTSMAECNAKAAEIFKNVKAGSARVWCHKVYEKDVTTNKSEANSNLLRKPKKEM